ncbi:alanine--tRNA ligase-related protein [Actinacidiphila yeochonensis]|uniref:alanine--tRNA ligase-related protein n=1 Tax=Actinacidiphila yeochonensis TaxID=89050 RepID=UPI00099CB7A6|nr:alanine--tRNA ligase-related protein [Actinacidiphila yeochonensis]
MASRPPWVATAEGTAAAFLGFFRDRGHHVLPGESLVRPPDDPVLFTTSGMHPLTPYLTGRPHPLGVRLADVQRCLRTTDLDEVGDDNHLTAFQMLGSWSLGDYGGERSLLWGYDLLVDGYGIAPGRLHATVFGGDGQVGEDVVALRTWERLGVPVERTTGDNWWSNGPTGPCGPDSEIFVWTGDGPPTGSPASDPRWWEVWNHVTMRYRRHEDGSLTELSRGSVDTGMGLERLVTVLEGVRSVYDSEVFADWRRLLPSGWTDGETSWRIVADHLRSAVVLVGDGVRPAAGGQGYVLRRLLRRALTLLWRVDPGRSLDGLPLPLVTGTLRRFGLPEQGCERVAEVLPAEERRFAVLLERGRRVLRQPRFARPPTEEDYAYLHDTHGLPRDLVDQLRREGGAPGEVPGTGRRSAGDPR